MVDFSSAWEIFVSYIDDGISLIPVREQEELVGDKVMTKKSPFRFWKKCQKERMKKEELWYQLEQHKVSSVGTLCGKISGNLEAIDIDSKFYPGIEKLLFEEIKNVMPGLIDLLRINKTPSGGYHILYRVEESEKIPGNKKLALRYSTKEELESNPNDKLKCFLETRGEGGYVVAPPSLGYKNVKNNPLPVLTRDQRETLINICISFNEVVKEEKKYEFPGQDSIYYSENPFESYNRSGVSEMVLLNNGWKYHSKGNKGINFTRPGSRSGGQHATFLTEKRYFIFFTPNCPFENGKCFHPSSVRATLEFGGDKKSLFKVLVSEGFGRINPEKEKKIVKTAIVTGNALPANVSDTAKEYYASAVIDMALRHPHGIFWQLGPKDGWEISREDIYRISDMLGYRLWKDNLYQLDGKFLHKKTDQEYYDTLNAYVFDEDGDVQKSICNCLEAFFQKSGEYTIGRLRHIKKEQLFSDTREVCYKFYLNGFLCITANGIEFKEIGTIGGYVLYDRVQQREFKFGNVGGKYIDFLNLACRLGDKMDNIQSIVGYLSHDYRDSTTPYIIVLTEECEDPKKGGGSGKNLFCTLLKSTITLTNKNGAQIQKVDERFLQAWNGERVLSIDDVPKGFDYTSLKDMSSGSAIIKKLYKDEMVVACEDMCKFIVQSNYGIDKADGGIERRIRQIEFTDFFTKAQGVNTHYGIQFPEGWDENDWIGYDNFIAQCVRKWLAAGLVLEKVELTIGGKLKEFDGTYGRELRLFFEENWSEWKGNFISNESFKFLLDTSFGKYQPSMQKINKALSIFCDSKGYVMDKNAKKDVGMTQERGKEFLEIFDI